jgi:hypothetical protein
MEAYQYKALIAEFAQLAGLADPKELTEKGLVNIGGLDMLLHYDHAFDPELLQVRIDLGDPPENKFLAVMVTLMSANYVLGNGGTFVFSLLPETTRVVFTAQQKIDTQFTAQDLWQALSDIARQSRNVWDGTQAPDMQAARQYGLVA